jgi:hypothetical protein
VHYLDFLCSAQVVLDTRQAHISDQLVARKGGVLFLLVGEEVHVVKNR